MRALRSYPLLIAGTLALLLACTALSLWAKRSERDYFARALGPIAGIEVSIKDRAYVVDYGSVYQGGRVVEDAPTAVLRLAYEKSSAERNPLMALPGVDPKKLEDATLALHKTASALADQQTNARHESLVRNTLYPFDFLASVANLERTRQEFIDDGSDENARRYRKALNATFAAYKKNLNAFKNAFEETVPMDAKQYANLTSIIRPADVLGAIDQLRTGMHKTQGALQRRVLCFEGYTSACNPSDITLPELRAQAEEVRPDALALTEEVKSLVERAGVRLIAGEPLYLVAESRCNAKRPESQFFFTFREQPAAGNAPTYEEPAPISNPVYVPSAPYAHLPYYRYFAANRIAHVVTAPFTYYECMQTDSEQGRRLAMRVVRAYALAHPVSMFADGERRESLQELEQKFAFAAIISETDIVRYMAEARAILDTPELPQEERRAIISLVLQMHTRSLGLYQTILNINRFEPHNISISALGADIDFTAFYLFYTRSAFASLFMQGNQSAVGTMGELFPRNTLPASEQPYIYYSELRKEAGIQDEILKDMRFNLDLHLMR